MRGGLTLASAAARVSLPRKQGTGVGPRENGDLIGAHGSSRPGCVCGNCGRKGCPVRGPDSFRAAVD